MTTTYLNRNKKIYRSNQTKKRNEVMNNKINGTLFVRLILIFAVIMMGCKGTGNQSAESSNPFFVKSTLPFEAPPFDKIKDSDFKPAFEKGMQDQLAEIQKIANDTDAPTFDNTLVELEKSGRQKKYRIDQVRCC